MRVCSAPVLARVTQMQQVLEPGGAGAGPTMEPYCRARAGFRLQTRLTSSMIR